MDKKYILLVIAGLLIQSIASFVVVAINDFEGPFYYDDKDKPNNFPVLAIFETSKT